MRHVGVPVGIGLSQLIVAATLVAANWGHRWTPAWLLLVVALASSAASKIDADAIVDDDRRRRRSTATSHLLDAVVIVAGYRAFVEAGTYPALTEAYVLVALAALVFVGLAVETVRGNVAVPGSESGPS